MKQEKKNIWTISNNNIRANEDWQLKMSRKFVFWAMQSCASIDMNNNICAGREAEHHLGEDGRRSFHHWIYTSVLTLLDKYFVF